MLAINVDETGRTNGRERLQARSRFPFRSLFATEEVAGIYNIIYRHLFDRRRDLPIPISFLLDRDGMIVKVYQGR